jgi:hypothetical protein
MIYISEESIMVYEDRDELDLAEEDRLYEQNPYQGAEFSDTFREQLGENADDDLMSEDEAGVGSAPMTEAEPSGASADDFGETVTPAGTTAEGEENKEQGFQSTPNELDEE